MLSQLLQNLMLAQGGVCKVGMAMKRAAPNLLLVAQLLQGWACRAALGPCYPGPVILFKHAAV